ncbi:methylated-DNA--[protein]-cysteine S-methyltransferase [Halomonas sp. DP5Y7-2]|nr:methylated-DNA--[protein]-cysteine S-methyltransferase [Halomonas sp. DP5Y7-2]
MGMTPAPDTVIFYGHCGDSIMPRRATPIQADPQTRYAGFAGIDVYHPPASSALGAVVIAASARGIARIDFMENAAAATSTPRATPLTEVCREQLTEFFAGQRQQFDLPLEPQGTEFQRQVWQALAAIPFGETRSYGQLAEGLGRKGAQRAVGAANGRNPISIVIPCHRVIGSDGSLTGYAGGMGRKQWLLAFEAQEVPLTLC